jgi:hypothetical protein
MRCAPPATVGYRTAGYRSGENYLYVPSRARLRRAGPFRPWPEPRMTATR